MKNLDLQIEMTRNQNECRRRILVGDIEIDILIHIANPNLLGLRL